MRLNCEKFAEKVARVSKIDSIACGKKGGRERAASRGLEENFRLKLVLRPRASFPVVAHPSRLRHAERLNASLGSDPGIGEWKRNIRKSRSNRPTRSASRRLYPRVPRPRSIQGKENGDADFAPLVPFRRLRFLRIFAKETWLRSGRR